MKRAAQSFSSESQPWCGQPVAAVEGDANTILWWLPEGGQILIEKQGKFWLEDGLVHQSPDLKNMMEIVNARAAGKLQLK